MSSSLSYQAVMKAAFQHAHDPDRNAGETLLKAGPENQRLKDATGGVSTT